MTFILVSPIVWRQVGSITGSVILNDTKQPARQALVNVYGYGLTITDSNGHYTIAPLPIGKYIVTVSYIGYKTSTTKWIIVTDGKETRLHVRLRKADNTKKKAIVVSEYIDPNGKKLSGEGCRINLGK